MFHKSLFLSFALALALAACGSSATPQLIGSYPQGGEPPIAYYEPAPGPRLTITYNASLELEVEDTQRALYNLQWVASQHNGYLLSSRTWYEGNLSYGEATLAVPVSRFEAARSALHGLGSVRAESISGELEPVYGSDGDRLDYSNITVTLTPASANWGRQISKFLTGVLQFVFWTAVLLIPPALMMIGLVTVVRWVGGRLKGRARLEE